MSLKFGGVSVLFLDSTYKWDHKVFVFLWLISLSITALEVHPCYHKWQQFNLFYGWVIFHCVYTYHIFICWWTRCLPILAIVNNTEMNMKVHAAVCSVAQSCLTLCDTMDHSTPRLLCPWVPLGKILEWVAFPFFRGSFQPRDRTVLPCITGRFFTTEPLGKPTKVLTYFQVVFSICLFSLDKYPEIQKFKHCFM